MASPGYNNGIRALDQLLATTAEQTSCSGYRSSDSAGPNPFAAHTLGGLFLRSVARYASQPALWTEDAYLTYADLAQVAGGIGHALIEAGLGRGGARCAVLGRRDVADYAGILGAALGRCTYVPLNVRHPVQRLATILDEADISALVVGQAGLETARQLLEHLGQSLLVMLPETASAPDWTRGMSHRVLCRDELPCPGLHGFIDGDPDDGAYLLFTSGSTGTPKGVLVRNRNVMPYLRWAADRYRPTAADRCTQLFDLTFDLSVHDLFLCWGAGATLYRIPDRARFAPRDFVRRHELTMWFSVPSTAATMLGLRALRPGDFPSLRVALFCGEALPARLAASFAAAAPQAVLENLYGPTEATIAIATFRLPDDPGRFESLPDIVPIGHAFPEQQAVLVDSGGMPAAEGELCLAGSQVTDGYWRRADLTAQRFVRFPWDDRNRVWYRTGDRAKASPEHGILFLGRLDRQAKIAGHRVELQEVEAALHQASAANSAAIAWPIGPDGLARGIVGFVGRTEKSIETIVEACRAVLPPYATPAAVHLVEDWPVNTSGKTDYGRLRQLVEKTSCHRT